MKNGRYRDLTRRIQQLEIRVAAHENRRFSVTAIVGKKGSQYCVFHCHNGKRGKVIKCFKTKKEALKMHRAIMANK